MTDASDYEYRAILLSNIEVAANAIRRGFIRDGLDILNRASNQAAILSSRVGPVMPEMETSDD